MGWFDEQIKQRKKSDNRIIEESFVNIADAVMGRRTYELSNKSQYTFDEVGEILKYYGYSQGEIPEDIEDINEQLEFICRPHGLMRRDIKLKKGFYKDAIGAILAFEKETNRPIALIPSFTFGYYYTDNGKKIRVSKKNQDMFEEDAICFYKQFPMRKLNTLDLLKFAYETINLNEIILTLCLMGITTLVGLLIPKLNYFLTSSVLDEKSPNLLLSTLIFMACINLGNLFFSTANSTLSNHVNTKMSVVINSATMARVLSLPANFFRDYSSGEITSRIQYVSSLANTVMSSVMSIGLTSIFSLAYVGSIFVYTPTLVIPALLITLATVITSIISTLVLSKLTLKSMEIGSKENGLSYALINGIQKIKLSGAEKRAFAKWGNLFSKLAEVNYKPRYITLLSTIISFIGTIVMYYVAVISNVSIPEYYAFNSAYGMVSGAFMSLASIVLTIANIQPTLKMAKPILDAVPEVSENKEVLTRIQGGIELSNVTFRYDDNSPQIIDNLSLKIKPGQYIAIVGKTGCGKSTLIRLLLGFEKPQRGAIYYDGKDINSIDLKSLRRKIGTVMQSGKLFMGDIYSNIIISAPWLTLDDAWQAAEMAGIADDIKRMPMGMNTLISEGSGGISGGQRQRIMIARAIAPKPRILIFDEATSALDNITQKKISESLDSLKCTRIVIAHRLSTIQHCDRILYLEDGKIVEDGTYKELIKLNGKFAELVERQRLDVEDGTKKKRKVSKKSK